MIGEQINRDSYVTVATKVPAHVADLLSILARQRGMEVYELLQLLLNGFITAAKADGPLSPELKTLIEAIQVDSSWKNAFSFTGISSTTDIEQAILILRQRDIHGHPKQGYGIAMIDHPFCGGTTMNICVDDILERVAEVSMKGLYKNLRQMGVMLNTQSLRETLTLMCDAQLIEHLNEEFANEMPGYGEHHDYGKQIEYGKKTKRVPHRTPDSVANSKQQTIQFGEYDFQLAEEEAKRDLDGELCKGHATDDDLESEMGFRPFTAEW